MLKNKFGMLKVLALALSVLMLVTLAACGNNGVAQEDMDNAIQAALDAQAKIEESKQAALASSLAQAQADAAQQAAAAQSSLEAAQAEASKQAAEASKAASIAESKAASAAIEASKAAASASEALKTTKPTTTTTAAPIVKDDITAVQAKFAELKHELTNPLGNGKYYLSADYAELTLLFDKAAVELQNALTVAAAESILATVEVEARAIKNAKTEAAKVQDLVNGLGDIETEVFTTALEKKDEAKIALGQFLFDYAEFFNFSKEMMEDIRDAEDMLEVYFGEFSIEEAESYDTYLERQYGLVVDSTALMTAEAKIEVLVNYIEDSLTADMKALYVEFEYDFDEEGDDLDDKVDGETAYDVIKGAYYKYLVISKVNGGDVAQADLPIEWDYLYDEDTGKPVKAGKDTNWVNPWTGEKYEEDEKVLDEEAPTAWFTVEEFMEIFVTPYLNYALQETKDDAVEDLYAMLTVARNATSNAVIYDNIAAVAKNKYVVSFDDAEDALEEIAEAFEAELEDITFVGDYKGNATLVDAQLDVWTKYVNAYISAANALIETSKDYALEIYNEEYNNAVEELDTQYEDRDDESSAAAKAQRLAALDAKKATFEANVEAAPVYTLEDLTSVELLKKYDKAYDDEDPYYDIIEYYILATGVEEELIDYIDAVVVEALKKTFSTQQGTQEGYLGDAVAAFVEDLLIFRDRIDPTNDEADIYEELRGTVIPYANGEGYADDKYYSNTAKFEQLVAAVDKAIDDLYAVSVENYSDTEKQLITPDDDKWGAKKGKVYWINEQAKAWFEASDHDHDWLINEEFLANADLKVEVEGEDGTFKLHAADENGLIFNACACGQDLATVKVTKDEETQELKDPREVHAKLDATTGKYVICDCQAGELVENATFNVPTYVKDTSRGKVIYKSGSTTVKEGDFLTLNNTGVPFNYTQTAEQLAIIAAQDIYKAAYTNIQATIIALPELDYLAEAVKDVTGTTEYKAIVSNVSGNADLKAEVEAYAKVYTDKMTSESKNVKYGFTGNSIKTPASFSGYVNVAPEEQFSYKDDFGTNADRYDYDNVVTMLDGYVTKFDNTFYTANKADSNVVELWYFKQDAVEYITNTINGFESVESNVLVWNPGYKNTYKAETSNNVTTITQRVGSYYVYDAGLTAASTAGKKFDAELTALLESYVAKIEGVKLNARTKVTNYYGETLCSAASDFAWTLASAKKTVSAYVVDLLGKEEAGATYNSAAYKYDNTTYEAKNGSVYKTGDSRVLLAYKTIYEGDFTAYAPTKYCACGNLYNP